MLNQLPNLVRLLVIVAGGLGVKSGLEHIARKKVFISFAIEDKSIRDLLVGQSSNKNTPFEFTDMSVKEPWDSAWKTQCRERIKKCHGVLVLVSKNTYRADGVHWEIKCAKEEGISIRAIYAHKDSKNSPLPDELKRQHIYKWSWSNINKFVDKLN